MGKKDKGQQFNNFSDLAKAMGYESNKNYGKGNFKKKKDYKEKSQNRDREPALHYCPKDTKKLVEEYYNKIDNFNLKLNHFAQFKGDKFKFFDNKKLIVKPNFNQAIINAIQQRQQKQKEALFPTGELYRELKFTPDWRLIIGLGQESVYETSITLHHIYGIPYIPASAIKGVIRHYAINSNPDFEVTKDDKEKFKNREDKAFKINKELCDIFGCDEKSHYKKAQEGQIIFFDAFPTKLTDDAIQPDVMNVHYPKYYGPEKEPPTDTQNPNPIFFLTVQNTPFQFIIGIKEKEDADKLLEKTAEYLKNALEQHGIGAKTAVGYGYLASMPLS